MDITAFDDYINMLDDAIATLHPSRVRQLEWLRTTSITSPVNC